MVGGASAASGNEGQQLYKKAEAGNITGRLWGNMYGEGSEVSEPTRGEARFAPPDTSSYMVGGWTRELPPFFSTRSLPEHLHSVGVGGMLLC